MTSLLPFLGVLLYRHPGRVYEHQSSAIRTSTIQSTIILEHSTLELELPSELMAQLKAIAAHHGWSVDYLVENLLAHYLGTRHYINMDDLLMARDQYRDAQSHQGEGDEEDEDGEE